MTCNNNDVGQSSWRPGHRSHESNWIDLSPTTPKPLHTTKTYNNSSQNNTNKNPHEHIDDKSSKTNISASFSTNYRGKVLDQFGLEKSLPLGGLGEESGFITPCLSRLSTSLRNRIWNIQCAHNTFQPFWKKGGGTCLCQENTTGARILRKE